MDSIQASTEPIKRTNKLPRFAVLGVLVALVLAACSPADAQDNEPDPTDVKPAVAAVMALDGTAAADFQYMPNEIIDELEWDIEIEYNTRDVRMVFDHYDALLVSLGFDQKDIEVEDDDEIEAEYRNSTTGVWVEIEVERDDGRVEVDMDIEDPRTYAADAVPSGFSLTEFMGWDIPVNIAGVTIRDIEWDFSFDHPEADYRDVIAYYDQHLQQDLGWNQTDVEDDGDEWEAEYRQNGVHIDLEVEEEDDGRGAEVEIELNKLRFYQSQQ